MDFPEASLACDVASPGLHANFACTHTFDTDSIICKVCWRQAGLQAETHVSVSIHNLMSHIYVPVSNHSMRPPLAPGSLHCIPDVVTHVCASK